MSSTRIDTPQSAARLPVLNPPVLSLLNGAFNRGASLESAELQMEAGGQTDVFRYEATPEGGLVASGTVAGQPFSETWIKSADGGTDIDGTIGDDAEHLHVHSDDQYWYLEGRVGSVDVREKGFVVSSPSGGGRYVLDGTVGDVPAHSELYGLSGGLLTYGYVGGSASTSNLKAQPTADPSVVEVNGQGEVAGTAFTLSGTLHIDVPTPPAPPPPPTPAPQTPPDLDIPTPDWDPVIWPPE